MRQEIVSFKWAVTPKESKTHIKGDFIVDAPFDRLVFDVSYSPKFEEDEDKCLKLMIDSIEKYNHSREIYTDEELKKFIPLANHVAWSIDSPNGWIGTKHKHDPKQIIQISKDKSSDGFFPCGIIEGTWSITASLTAIITENVQIDIKVFGEAENEMV